MIWHSVSYLVISLLDTRACNFLSRVDLDLSTDDDLTDLSVFMVKRFTRNANRRISGDGRIRLWKKKTFVSCNFF